MVKKHALGYQGISQDTSKPKTKNTHYFSALNIRIRATDNSSNYAVTNEKGNELSFSIPTVTISSVHTRFVYVVEDTNYSGPKFLNYSKDVNETPGNELENNYLPGGTGTATSGEQFIIGSVDTRNGALILTTDNGGWDCMWEVSGIGENNIELTLLYVNNLGLSTNNLVQLLYNYENSIIEKVYMADGNNQFRYMNIRQSVDNGDAINLADMKASSINSVSEYDLSQISVKSIVGGGYHTAGVIQYAYNLYILNGAQTTISPVSELVPLTKGDGLGGGDLNESVNRTVIVNVDDIDKTFTHIRLYAIKYTSYNESPQVSLISDREIDNYDSLSYYDEGSVIQDLSLEEFLFLGSDPIIPKHIESKDSRLFAINVKEKSFDVDIDTRCYGHDDNGDAMIWENIEYSEADGMTGDEMLVDSSWNVPEKHDAVNRNYNEYKYAKTISSGGLKEYSSIIINSPAVGAGTLTVGVNGTSYAVPVTVHSSVSEAASEILLELEPQISSTHEMTIINGNNIVINALVSGDQVATTISGDALLGMVTTVVTIQNGNTGGVSYGAEGKYFGLTIEQNSIPEDEVGDYKLLKDREIYRYGIVFFNDLGQRSSPSWMCDVKTPDGNLEGLYNQVKLNIKQEFYDYLNNTTFEENQKPVGYRVVRADRKLADRTILTQGIINPMIVNFKSRTKLYGPEIEENSYLQMASKMPSVLRTFEDIWPFSKCDDKRDLSLNNVDNYNRGRHQEAYHGTHWDEFRAQSWQFNQMMQLFSPELLFENVEIDSSYKLNVIGMVKRSDLQAWGKEWSPFSLSTGVEARFDQGITIGSPGVNVTEILGDPAAIYDNSYFGPTNANDGFVHINQHYREFKGGFIKAQGDNLYEMYGSPEVTQKGAEFNSYNNDSKFRYCNNLLSMLVDHWDEEANDDAGQQLFGDNSYGPNCITFVEGSDDPQADAKFRKNINDFKDATGISDNDGMLMAEFVRDENYVYLGNIYGGNNYESKSVVDYIDIGEYRDITETSQLIQSPGDTFVQDFNFEKLSKTETQVSDTRYNQSTEIVSYICESTVDLKNRNDASIGNWDNKWQPSYEAYQNYNRVYSQQSTLIKSTDPGFKFKKIKEFDTRIMASKSKIPGENIDNFTDFLENEVMDLDGKYGPINGTVNLKDEIFVLQESGVAKIAINPRVQIEGSDGVSIELGKGGVLHDYNYISTKNGCLNKWSIKSTDNGFYFFDLGNLSIMRYNGQLESVTNASGLHSFFEKNISYDDISQDNPLLRKGISAGYDSVKDDVYFTFRQLDFSNDNSSRSADYSNDFTICFNEATSSFTSFYSFLPTWYLSEGSVLMTTGNNNRDYWKHHIKGSNSFYGNEFSSNIIFNVAPDGDGEFTFNNLAYKMEMKDIYGNDVLNETFTNIMISNEYQESALTPIVVRKNAKRRNRSWSITMPREFNTRNRIKSPWMKMKLILNNSENYEMVAHDLIVSYTEY